MELHEFFGFGKSFSQRDVKKGLIVSVENENESVHKVFKVDEVIGDKVKTSVIDVRTGKDSEMEMGMETFLSMLNDRNVKVELKKHF